MKTIAGIFFSFRLTGVILTVFIISIALATLIENDFGSETARAHIYNATWFELLFILALTNLLGNMVIHHVYRRSKLSIFIFHFSFILIILGAGITRYLGFTGIMHIREGSESRIVHSDEAYLNVQVLSEDIKYRHSEKIYLSGIRNPRNLVKLRNAGARIRIQYIDHSIDGRTALSLRILTPEDSRDITLWGGKGMTGEPTRVSIGKYEMLLSYGSITKALPFSLRLEDFIMERYPGSDSPSSFESRVILKDAANELEIPHSIYMNHILSYQGYRFYQSSYDSDEMGTVLSVNRDPWGTLVTYGGYLLLFLGILLSLFNPDSRFRSLSRHLEQAGNLKKSLVLLAFLGLNFLQPAHVFAGSGSMPGEIPSDHAKSFSKVLVQDHQGRIKPVNTLASEAIRKIARKTRLEGRSPDEVMLGMLTDPLYWQNIPMIRVSHPVLQEFLGIEDKYASFLDFFHTDQEEAYKIAGQVREAHRKKSSDRSKFDTEVLRVDERMNICYMIYTGSILRILPDRNDPGKTWHSPLTIHAVYTGEDSLFASNIVRLYLESVLSARETGDWSEADEYLGYIKVFQDRMGGDIMPSSFRQKTEILYNRVNIFDRLARFYLSFGVILLLVQVMNILGSKLRFTWLRRVMVIHVIIAFLLHGVGLLIRWYIAGHAPWSNGYESLIYISWTIMLAGILFSRRTSTPLAATAIMSWMILHTAHLSWMDPQMTNLVPVLKSYWLTIHVAVIASSYGFLGLAALMGFMNLVLMAIQTRANMDRVGQTVLSLSRISEMTIIAGLGLLTIGTFLGAIWANESWGRYWAWDAKESWALITVLVYAFIVHMRFIPGLKSAYLFNLASVLGYASVLMTYFGVNYYLSGMHSYAAGDPVPVPNFVYYTLVIILVVAMTSYFRDRVREKKWQ